MIVMDWTDIVILITPFVLLLAASGLIAWGKQDKEAKEKYGLDFWADVAVAAAEQLFSANDQKYRYVMAHLAAKFPWLSEHDLRALVEWATHNLKLRELQARGPQQPLHSVPPAAPPVEIDYERLARAVAAELARLPQQAPASDA